MRKNIFQILPKLLLLVCSLLVLALAEAEVAVIVHPSNQSKIPAHYVAQLFLGQKRAFPSGVEALPVDQPNSNEERSRFATGVLKKDKRQLRSYWAKLIFTGRAFPPEVLQNSEQVKALVAENPNAIGYIDSAQIDSSVRVIARY